MLVILQVVVWWKNHDLSASLKDLTASCFGCTPDQTRREAFLFDSTKVTNYLWDNDKMCVDKDWFLAFLKINGDIALNEPNGLSSTA